MTPTVKIESKWSDRIVLSLVEALGTLPAGTLLVWPFSGTFCGNLDLHNGIAGDVVPLPSDYVIVKMFEGEFESDLIVSPASCFSKPPQT